VKGVDVQAKGKDKRNNFYRVISRASSDYRFYRRNLFSLMKLCVQGDEYDLALDLGKFFSALAVPNTMNAVF